MSGPNVLVFYSCSALGNYSACPRLRNYSYYVCVGRRGLMLDNITSCKRMHYSISVHRFLTCHLFEHQPV